MNKDEWQIIILKKDGNVRFIYDSNVNKYELIGLLEMELKIIKDEIFQNIKKELKD